MSYKDQSNAVQLSRRAFSLAALGTATFGALGSRLYYLQVVKAEDYIARSEDNRFNFRVIVPSRGHILDRHGEALAVNKQEYRVILIPEQITDLNTTLDEISNVIEITPATRERIVRDVKSNASFVPVLVANHLDWASFSALNFRTPDLPGVIPQVGEGRSYPSDGVFSHVLGFVGTPGAYDIENDNSPLMRQPNFRIGKLGVEAAAEKTLRGEAGRLKVEVNALGRVVREWPEAKDQAVSGKDIWLTIDANLQRHAANLYGEDSGGAAVIDVMTGELRALVSMPTFDSNTFVSGISQAELNRMNNDEKRPQFNKVLSGAYPPASTFKMVVMLAAMQNKVISANERITCTGRVRLGNRVFHCWRRRGHGRMNMQDSLKYSCDTYFYELAQRLPVEAIRDAAIKLGLGQRYDISVGGQTEGIVPGPEWKRQRMNQGWRMGDSLNMSIGQGFVLTSPLQLAVMTARIANGREAVSPHLIIGAEAPRFDPLGFEEIYLNIVRSAMWRVTEEPGGTAYRPGALGFPNVQMAGKTGTAQVRGISAAERLQGVRGNQELPWHLRDHSLFVGFAPFVNPRFAAAAIVEHGGSGSGRAANIVRGLLSKALERDGFERPSDDGSGIGQPR